MQENVNIPDSNITANLTFRQLVLMNMQQLTNFPYIEKDFDALTDFELLCLVVKFLNDVIANQNEQNDSITSMYNAFLALQTYVNNTKDTLEDAFNNLDNYVRNYFDNLDVQEEINNKLDQMLEDGVLEQIIEQFIQSTALWCFDTVADMKLATNLINGSYARTLGFYAINDNGGSLYKITNTGTANERDVIALQNDLYANLVITSPNVKLEMYGGKGDNSYINDDAFVAAVNSGCDIDFVGSKSYKFSGELIDLATLGRKIVFNGNNCDIYSLSFRYNITSDNKRAVGSAIQSFPICFKDITFYNNTTPIMITTGNIDVERCNFYDCDYCFGLPEFYVDYFHASDCYFSNTARLISPIGYDGNATSKGMYGDWITFDRCSFDWNQVVYESSVGHSSTVFIRNCLHGTFTLNTSSSINRSYFIFDGCHNESHDDRPPFITFTGTGIPSNRAVTVKNSYLYSEALPDDLSYIEMDKCTINYGNLGNYKIFETERGSFERTNMYGIVWYDETAFKLDKAEHATTSGQYASTLMSSNTELLQTYPNSHLVSYTAGTSLEKERLYFNGETPTLYWTSNYQTEAGKCPVFNTSTISRSDIKNVYLHVYKVMDGTTYKCVIPVTNIIRPNDTVDSIVGSLYLADEPQGIFGCPWVKYNDTVEYVAS